MEKKLEQMIIDYRTKKAELEAAAKAELAPIWSEVIKLQTKIKNKKIEEKKAKRIAFLREELAKLES